MVLDNARNEVPVLHTQTVLNKTHLKNTVCDMQISKYQRKFTRLACLHHMGRITNGSAASKLEIG